jgi:hypothetical protein
VAKVKKRTALTGVRNAKAGTGHVKAGNGKLRRKKKPAVRQARTPPPEPQVRVRIRELDPQQKCGEGTSVQFLYRVDQTVDGRPTAHLVFFDQHGWYCEHGRTCPAVAHALKHNGQFRASLMARPRTGLTMKR